MAKPAKAQQYRSPVPAPAPRAPRTRRSVSLPLLVGTVVALLVLLPGLYFWRQGQVERGAVAYLERADRLAAEGRWTQSAEYLFLYLRMRPDDPDARIQLAETYDRLANRPPQLARAIELYYQALAAAPAERQRELRLRLAELLLQTGRFASAETEARELLDRDAQDAQGQRALALSLYGKARAGGLSVDAAQQAAVGAALESARKLLPGDVLLAVSLADVYRRDVDLQSERARKLSDAERGREADACLDELVQANPKDAAAHLARYQYRLANEQPGADDDLNEAVRLGPENPVVLLAAGDHDRRRALRALDSSAARAEALTRAVQFYERAIKALPAMERAYAGLGDVQLLQGDAARAVATWQLGLEKCGQQSVMLNGRLADVLIAQQDLDKAQERLTAIDSEAAALRQRGALEAQLGFARSADLLKARLLLARSQTTEAIDLLNSVVSGRQGGAVDNLIKFQALMILGNTYAAGGQPEKARTNFEQAAVARPEAPEPHLALASALMTTGHPELAIAPLSKAVKLAPTFENRLLLAGTVLRAQLKQPPAERDWSLVAQVLEQAKPSAAEADREPWRYDLLHAEYLARRGTALDGQTQQHVLATLRTAEKRAAGSLAGLDVLAQAYERYGSPADADRIAAALTRQFPQAVEAYLTPAALLAGRKRYDDARTRLTAGLSAVPADRRLDLRLRLVALDIEQGRQNEAWQALVELQREEPANRGLLEGMLELAIDTGKFADAEKLEGQLSALPAIRPSDWQYYRARRLLAQAANPKDTRLSQAETLIQSIRKERPTWPNGHLLWADLLERRGDTARAVEAYRTAIQMGEQRLAAYERLIMLLYELERFSEADQYLSQLADRSPSSSTLSTLNISEALRAGRLEQALELARLGVERRPKDPLAHVWLGQLLVASAQPQQAEQALRQAVAVGPGDPRAYGALVNFLARAKRTAEAQAVVEEFSTQIAAPPEQKALLLAAGYEAIGDTEKSLAKLREAEQLAPASAVVQQRLAAALADTDRAAAERALRRALELDPQNGSSRRMLAGLLADNGGERAWQEALALLGDPAAEDAAGDQRLQAFLLARRGGQENLAKARQVIESTLAERPVSARNDRLLLAQIAEAEGDLDKARKEYLALASEEGALREHLSAYVAFLLRQNALREAATWLDKLERMPGNDLAALALRVQLLAALKQDDRIEPLLERAAERLLKPGDPQRQSTSEQMLDVCVTIGDLYSSVRQVALAERWYQRAYKLDPNQYARLARTLAMRGRVAEAIQLCTAAAERDPSPRPAAVLATLLVETRPNDPAAAAAEELFSRALAAHGRSAELLEALGNLRLLQRRLDEACDLYQRAVETKPNSIDLLNNLATALAEHPRRAAEALKYIDMAIELAGPQPNLLDTKGTILLALNQAQAALPILKAAASTPGADPRFYFHLAVGHYRTGDMANARAALATARSRELERAVLTDSDTRLLAELDARLR